MNKNNQQTSRRKFIKKITQYSIGGAAINAFGLTSMLSAQQALADEQDYKALVYVFLAGGNDSFNMLAPKGASPLRTNYETGRRNISLSSETLHELQLQQTAKVYNDLSHQGFGLHPACGDLADMFNNQELAFICNIGNLVKPTTRQAILDKSAELPPQLYSHSDQQLQFQSEPVKPFRFGWGGRMAELLTDFNQSTTVSPLISVAGLNSFQVSLGNQLSTYAMGMDGAASLSGFNGSRKTILNNGLSSVDNTSHLMIQKYRDIFNSAKQAEVVVKDSFTAAESLGVNYNDAFEEAGVAASKIGRQLKSVAKMIAGRQSTGNNRPIFFVKMGGFDGHQNLLTSHQSLLAELNGALKAFRNVLVEQGDFDKTLTFVGSEFGRTLTPNGDGEDAGTGTDHAWGGHAIALGGMINGGQLFGTHPDLALNQGLDASKGRGRWIPTTATSQVNSVMAHWFGVSKQNIPLLFPSISNFADPFQQQANLNFIK